MVWSGSAVGRIVRTLAPSITFTAEVTVIGHPRATARRVLPALLGALLLLSCSTRRAERMDDGIAASALGPPTGPAAALAVAIERQEAASARLLAIEGVVGTGAALDDGGRPVIVVLGDRAGLAGVPDAVGGVRVVIERTGAIRPFALTQRYRPVPIGVSAGNANDCIPGTIGCVLTARGKSYLLSANHVFARQNQAAIGEWEMQPSRPDADPSCGAAPPGTLVAKLADFEPVVYDGSTPNAMDAAIAELATNDFTCATPAGYYGLPSSQPVTAGVGSPVLKVGRTTELTRGSIKAVNVKVKVTFPSGTALFVNQLMTSKDFGAFGDSGSLVVTDDGEYHPVGMVIGGSSNGAAIVTPIGPILARFGAAVCGR